MSSELGLRERKKQQTRQQLAETARRLFVERGFDSVTVADVAKQADVAVATVFNYFPTKEDLFYSGMESFEAQLLASVGDRPAGAATVLSSRVVVCAAQRLTRDIRRSARLAVPRRSRVDAPRSGRSARRQPRGRCTGWPRRVGAGTRTGLGFSDLGAGGEGPVASERSRGSYAFAVRS